jgi:hypothetical protein
VPGQSAHAQGRRGQLAAILDAIRTAPRRSPAATPPREPAAVPTFSDAVDL